MGETKMDLMQKGGNAAAEAYKSGSVQYIDSREVADIIGKQHKNLLADITRYSKEFTQLNFQLTDFFLESSYTDASGKNNRCYLVTRKGCELIAHKLTGIKGTKFSATYINRFHEMEDALGSQIVPELQKFMEEQAEFNRMVMDRLASDGRHGADARNPFSIRGDAVKGRMKALNGMVDEVASLCGMERNMVLHYMYMRIQEHFSISLNPYLTVMRAESQDDGICGLHVIASVDRFYEAAVEMNRCVIERKKLYG